ncbi:MAG: succinate--CoA ligase subunit alpha [Anaerolineae bacterium]|nr:succinate--CoA ligase subunit alpha [Anaerolineae bacterium]
MAILLDAEARVLVQGITGEQGSYHTRLMLDYGTRIVGGVTPLKGGEWAEGKPVFDTVHAARQATEADCSVVFVPGGQAASAILEAIDAGISLIVCITEGIPLHDMLRVRAALRNSPARLIGPNSPGIITPGQANLGIIPADIAHPGHVGIVSRSGSLSYEVIHALSAKGIGQSTCVGIGADPIIGSTYVDILRLFEEDPQTRQIVLIGEIGGQEEQRAAAFIRDHLTKPVVAYIAGEAAPRGVIMGHAGALVEHPHDEAAQKREKLASVGVRVASHPEEIARML